MVNWTAVFNRLFKLINNQGEASYFGGPRFIKKVQEELDPDFPDYYEYLKDRRTRNESTTRQTYYKDILLAFDEGSRFKLVDSILREVGDSEPEQAQEIRKLMGGGSIAPRAGILTSAWNAAKLNGLLVKIDEAIQIGNYSRAVTLSYTCLEGFFGAFARAKLPGPKYPKEIIDLSKVVRDFLRKTNKDYPDEVLNLIGQVSHAVDRARNRFSEAHFGGDAGLWLASYMRDLVNTQIRLLLHFM